jgi:hypothetical protein
MPYSSATYPNFGGLDAIICEMRQKRMPEDEKKIGRMPVELLAAIVPFMVCIVIDVIIDPTIVHLRAQLRWPLASADGR